MSARRRSGCPGSLVVLIGSPSHPVLSSRDGSGLPAHFRAFHDFVDLGVLELDPERTQTPDRLAPHLASEARVLLTVPDTDGGNGPTGARNTLMEVLHPGELLHRRLDLPRGGADLLGGRGIETGAGDAEIHRPPPCSAHRWDRPPRA